MPRLPEVEALEQHADPLAPLGDPVEAPVEVQVLERRQLAVHQGVVGDESDLRALDVQCERASRRDGEAGTKTKERGLPGPVRPGDEEEPVLRHVERHAAKDATLGIAFLDAACVDHC